MDAADGAADGAAADGAAADGAATDGAATDGAAADGAVEAPDDEQAANASAATIRRPATRVTER